MAVLLVNITFCKIAAILQMSPDSKKCTSLFRDTHLGIGCKDHPSTSFSTYLLFFNLKLFMFFKWASSIPLKLVAFCSQDKTVLFICHICLMFCLQITRYILWLITANFSCKRKLYFLKTAKKKVLGNIKLLKMLQKAVG